MVALIYLFVTSILFAFFLGSIVNDRDSGDNVPPIILAALISLAWPVALICLALFLLSVVLITTWDKYRPSK